MNRYKIITLAFVVLLLSGAVGAVVVNIDGSGLVTSIGTKVNKTDAGEFTGGTFPDARLSSNVPLKNNYNVFTKREDFLGGQNIAGNHDYSIEGGAGLFETYDLSVPIIDVYGYNYTSGTPIPVTNSQMTTGSGDAVCRLTSGTHATVYNSGLTNCLVSSSKYKTNINNITQNATPYLKNLTVVTYTEISSGIKRVGFIAESVNNTMGQYAKFLIVYEPDNNSSPRGLNWEGMYSLTVKSLQEQISVNENQTVLLNKICNRNQTLCS